MEQPKPPPQPKAPMQPKPPKQPKQPKQPKPPPALRLPPWGSASSATAPPPAVHPTSRELDSIRSLLQDNTESPLSLLLGDSVSDQGVVSEAPAGSSEAAVQPQEAMAALVRARVRARERARAKLSPSRPSPHVRSPSHLTPYPASLFLPPTLTPTPPTLTPSYTLEPSLSLSPSPPA